MLDGNGGDHAQEKGRDFVDKVRSVCNKILRKCHKIGRMAYLSLCQRKGFVRLQQLGC